MQRISPAELDEWIRKSSAHDSRPVLLDVREPWEFEVCHIAGSRPIPMGRVPTQPAELDKDAATVVVCHHGVRSSQVAMFLENRGFSKVINLDGGVEAWAQQVDAAMPTY